MSDYTSTPIRIRKDIYFDGRYSYRKRNSASALIAKAMQQLTCESAYFGDFSDTKDAEVKKAIRLYFESWVVPLLHEAYDKTKAR